MPYSNSDKAGLVADSFTSQFSLNRDVVNTRMLDIVNSEVEQFLSTPHDNTLNPATSSEVISDIGNLRKNKSPASIGSLPICSYISSLISHFF